MFLKTSKEKDVSIKLFCKETFSKVSVSAPVSGARLSRHFNNDYCVSVAIKPFTLKDCALALCLLPQLAWWQPTVQPTPFFPLKETCKPLLSEPKQCKILL